MHYKNDGNDIAVMEHKATDRFYVTLTDELRIQFLQL